MTDHERFRLLIAKDLHQRLTADESGALEEHLATCPPCRRFSIELRHDDLILRAALTDAPVAAPVRRAVIDSASGRRRADMRLVLVLVATIVIGVVWLPLLVGGGSPASTSTPTPTPSPSASAASLAPGPTTSVAPGTSTAPGASTSPMPSGSPAAGGSVNGAYAYSVAPGSTRRDSVSARIDGGPVGEWSRMIPASGGASFGGPVTCLVIDGQDAWLAGPATTATDGSVDRAALLFVHDGGPGGEGDSAMLWMNDPGQTLATMEGWCTSRFIPADPYPLDDGDVSVTDGDE